MIEVGKISTITDSKSLARVNLCGRITPFLPVLQTANSTVKKWIPLAIDEQVLVLDDAFIIRGIFNKQCLEPAGANSHTHITEYSDGTRLEYDTNSHTLNIKVSGEVNLTANKISINDGAGVVTGECICAFTGTPHSDFSSSVKVGK